jgi:hypothetical protein
LTRAELQYLSADQLRIARNEIFARKGRYFRDDRLRAHFSQFPWYDPYTYDVSLNAVEQANVSLIQSLEKEARFAPPPPAPRYISSGHGLIGGVAWQNIAFYVPPDLLPERDQELRAEADKRLQAAMDLAGFPKDKRIDTSQYNFVLGLAVSSGALTDAARRALRDNLSKGRATPAMQEQYDLLRGRSFEPLDCHSNGAMICLAALSNQDVEAPHVRLFGPQLTPGALAEWKQLLGSHRIKTLQIYISDRDPVPPLSYLARNLIPGKPTFDTAVHLTSEALKDEGMLLEDMGEEEGLKIIYVDCHVESVFWFSLECHEVTHYQEKAQNLRE